MNRIPKVLFPAVQRTNYLSNLTTLHKQRYSTQHSTNLTQECVASVYDLYCKYLFPVSYQNSLLQLCSEHPRNFELVKIIEQFVSKIYSHLC